MTTPSPAAVDAATDMGDPVAVAALFVALLALAVSIWAGAAAHRSARAADEANNLVGVYKRAIWTVSSATTEHDAPVLILKNEGESNAANVLITLDADPLHLLISEQPIQLIPQRDFATVDVKLPKSAIADGVGFDWHVFFNAKEGVRRATVTWDDLEGKRRSSEVMIPPVLSDARPPSSTS